MSWVVLKTDLLFFVVIATSLVYAIYASRREHLAAPWRQVAARPMGMSAAVILFVFLVVAVLDSCHYHPRLEGQDNAAVSGEIESLLDRVVGPLRSNQEKTYSAPFATHAYAKETIEQANGSTTRDYPRLQYGGAHLADPLVDRGADIFRRAATGAALGVLVWLVLVGLVALAVGRGSNETFGATLKSIYRGTTTMPWFAILVTAGLVIVLVGSISSLAPYYHVLGTDKVGNDVLYQALKSIRTGLLIGTLTTLMMLPFAIAFGIAAGYFRGWVDDVIQYLYTTLSSIPGVLLIAASVLMLDIYMARHAEEYTSVVARADLRLLALCMILGVTSWTGLCRYLRGEALKLRESDFILAARGFGVANGVILGRHIVPNIMHIVMISIVLDFSNLVLAEAALTYINVGVDSTMESWGNMINSARLELAREPVVWWSLLAAFLFMFTLVLAANIFADAVRDAFDPRLREAR